MPKKWVNLKTGKRIISHFTFELKIACNDSGLNEN